MKGKKIYLVRHGQTDYNVQGIVQGRGVNSDINETGRKQARKFFDRYREEGFERIYVSHLKRTHQTMEPFKQLDLPTQAFEGLDEIDWGIKEKEKITSEENAYYHSLISSWQRGEVDRRIKGGESPQDVQDRLKPVIEEWKTSDEEKILVCTHGRTLRILLSTLLSYSLSEMDRFPHANLSLYKVIFTGSFFRIDSFNDRFHLR